MAKATAHCTCKTCGTEFDWSSVRTNSRDARSWEKWAEENITECPECRDARILAERDEAAKEAAEVAQANGYATLEGTEKQIAWAERIRVELIGKIVDESVELEGERKERAEKCVDALAHITGASWWIDHKDASMERICRLAYKMAEKEEEEEEEEPAKEESCVIVQPETQKHAGTVEVRVKKYDDGEWNLMLAYQKEDHFRTVVKERGYTWDKANGCWIKKSSFRTGTVEERIAEITHRLLNVGYAVQLPDASLLDKAVKGEYEPECMRWVSWHQGEGLFEIEFQKDESLYIAARKIPKSRYGQGRIFVPKSEYRSVLDFADAYGFKLSPGATEAVEGMERITFKVTPTPAKEDKKPDGGFASVLTSSREIIDDLKDE